jgi:uncharacterized protein (TIGR02391 family)
MNYPLVANQIGDLLKYSAVVNEIGRAAKSVFKFELETFPNDSMTSTRSKLIHDWVLTLAKQKMDNESRNCQLVQFIDLITPEENKEQSHKILLAAGVLSGQDNREVREFLSRRFHAEIHAHCGKLFEQGNYFHAVFEASKVYNKRVQEKAQITKDGQSLMMEAWSCSGVLKVTTCLTETDKNVQEGIKFLSAGLMQAMRNPTAHEPALDWPISKEDCLDMLSFISYLFKQLDKAVYFKKT